MVPGHSLHHHGPLELHHHVVVAKRYAGLEEISRRTCPFAPHYFSAQLMRMAVIMGAMCSVLVFGPLYFVRGILGGWEGSLLLTVFIYAILVTLYALYLHVWMRKASFRFFPEYIDISAGVFRRVERSASYADIQKVRIRQGLFERLGNIAHLWFDTGSASGSMSGDKLISFTLSGLSLDDARKLAAIVQDCIHPENKDHKNQ